MIRKGGTGTRNFCIAISLDEVIIKIIQSSMCWRACPFKPIHLNQSVSMKSYMSNYGFSRWLGVVADIKLAILEQNKWDKLTAIFKMTYSNIM